MRARIQLTLLCAFFGACDSSTTPTVVTHDLSAVADLTSVEVADFDGIGCGSAVCTGSQICCAYADVASQTISAMCEPVGDCHDGGVSQACDGAEDCAGNSCCATIMIGSEGDGGLQVQSGAAACTASCVASVTGSLTAATLQTKLCHVSADCTGYKGSIPALSATGVDFNECCTTDGLKFCAPAPIGVGPVLYTCP